MMFHTDKWDHHIFLSEGFKLTLFSGLIIMKIHNIGTHITTHESLWRVSNDTQYLTIFYCQQHDDGTTSQVSGQRTALPAWNKMPAESWYSDKTILAD